ncbi:MAG: hypothetical protein CM1200mP39_30810 [Dehalococcoidia bacterium]|nr:MAG: hypothetical protein CM1200mP39_30810 [Dehalococcoidia bacterium]
MVPPDSRITSLTSSAGVAIPLLLRDLGSQKETSAWGYRQVDPNPYALSI